MNTKKFILLLVLTPACYIIMGSCYGQDDCAASPKPYFFISMGSYVKKAPVPWSEGTLEAQGIAYVGSQKTDAVLTVSEHPSGISGKTINSYLIKIPAGVGLQHANVFRNAKIKYKSLNNFPALWNPKQGTGYMSEQIRIWTGYAHWGDPDKYTFNKTEYIVVPMTSGIPDRKSNKLEWGDPLVAIFRATDLSLAAVGLLPGTDGKGQKDVGWCAVNPVTGALYTSPDKTSNIFEYTIPWNLLPRSGYYGKFKIQFKTSHRMRTHSGNDLLLYNLQGGCMDNQGMCLYISNGGGACRGFGADHPGMSTDGIHAFDISSWREIRQSTNRLYLRDGVSRCCQPLRDYFDFSYDFGCGIAEAHSEQIEGMDISNGELKVVGVSVGVAGNQAWIERFSNRLYIDPARGKAPAWTFPLTGSKERPFKTVSAAIQFSKPPEGTRLFIKTPGNEKPSIMTLQGKVGYQIAGLPAIWEQGEILPDFTIELYNHSFRGLARLAGIDVILSPDPITPDLNTTKKYIKVGTAGYFMKTIQNQIVVVKGLRAPMNTGVYYLGTSVSCGPFSSPASPMAIRIVKKSETRLVQDMLHPMPASSDGLERVLTRYKADGILKSMPSIQIDSPAFTTGKQNNKPLIPLIKYDSNKSLRQYGSGYSDPDHFTVYPNPVSGTLHVQFIAPSEGTYRLRVVNIHGIAILEKQVRAKKGMNTADINTTGFTSGFYTVNLLDGTSRHTVRIVVN